MSEPNPDTMNTPQWFEPKLNAGSVINLIVLTVGLGTAWGVHKSTVQHLEANDTALFAADRELRDLISRKDQQITDLMIASVKQDQKLANIEKQLDKLVLWVESQRGPYIPSSNAR